MSKNERQGLRMNAKYEREIERLYLQMYDMMFTYAKSNLSNDELAEEAVQEAFQIACQKPEAVCSSECPEGWLVNTLKNVISNMKRRQQSAQQILFGYLSGQIQEYVVSEDRIGIDILYDNIAESEEFRLIKEMAIDGKSHLEMSQERGISIAACRKRVQRAKEILRNKIKL